MPVASVMCGSSVVVRCPGQEHRQDGPRPVEQAVKAPHPAGHVQMSTPGSTSEQVPFWNASMSPNLYPDTTSRNPSPSTSPTTCLSGGVFIDDTHGGGGWTSQTSSRLKPGSSRWF